MCGRMWAVKDSGRLGSVATAEGGELRRLPPSLSGVNLVVEGSLEEGWLVCAGPVEARDVGGALDAACELLLAAMATAPVLAEFEFEDGDSAAPCRPPRGAAGW